MVTDRRAWAGPSVGRFFAHGLTTLTDDVTTRRPRGFELWLKLEKDSEVKAFLKATLKLLFPHHNS